MTFYKVVYLGGVALYPSFPLTVKTADLATYKRSRAGDLRVFYRATKRTWTLAFDRIPGVQPSPSPTIPITSVNQIDALFAVKASKTFIDEWGASATVLIAGDEGIEKTLDFVRQSSSVGHYSLTLTLLEV